MEHRPVKLTADLVEALAGVFLSPRYDEPRPTPPFHREAWELYCSPHTQVACIAPRDHAKSTGLTFDYGLAEVLFRTSDYVIIIGSTEDKAGEQLGNLSDELHDNEELRREFGVKSFESDTKHEIIVRMQDDWRFRILARGAEQKIRGSLWKGKRPNLIICDDMEDDEQVENKDRRTKFRRWFFRAAKQALSQSGKIRVHGTILHEDSLLSRIRRMKSWNHVFYKAHNSFDDFGGLLWPERWTEERLRLRRQEFIEDGDSGGYSQEFLNDPQDNSDSFLRKDDFIPMTDDDAKCWKTVHAAADFAVSKADMANRTSFTVGGKCVRNLLHFLDFRVGRWDPVEWIDEIFSIQKRYSPEVFWVEDGVIWQAVKRIVFEEMHKRDLWINLEAVPSIRDKATRGTSLRKRMRAGGTRWNTLAEGYEDARAEMLRFTGNAAARLDDQFDSAALLSLGFDRSAVVEEEDEIPEEEWTMRREDPRRSDGRSLVTGY
jgi:hypothetical protein